MASEIIPKQEIISTLNEFVEDLNFKIEKGGKRLSPKAKRSLSNNLNFFKSILHHIEKGNG